MMHPNHKLSPLDEHIKKVSSKEKENMVIMMMEHKEKQANSLVKYPLMHNISMPSSKNICLYPNCAYNNVINRDKHLLSDMLDESISISTASNVQYQVNHSHFQQKFSATNICKKEDVTLKCQINDQINSHSRRQFTTLRGGKYFMLALTVSLLLILNGKLQDVTASQNCKTKTDFEYLVYSAIFIYQTILSW